MYKVARATSAVRQSVRCAATKRSPADDLLRHVPADIRGDVSRVVEGAMAGSENWSTTTTAFYPPPVVASALTVLEPLADVAAIPWGGYAQAERCRVIAGRAEALPAEEDLEGVVALRVAGNFMFDAAAHPDFLGAILGTGIDRSQVGDILLDGERGAQVLTTPDMAVFLAGALTSVRSVSVEASEVPLSELKVRAAKVKAITSVEASLRLDAVASAGFRAPRSKMTAAVKSGDVRLNWMAAKKASVDVKEGDVISCAGKGRVEVTGITQTKKGKFSVDMVRYV